MTNVRRHHVFYTLERENDAKTTRVPVATYPRYVEAFKDGLTFHDKDAEHMVITRHSLPL